MAYYLFIFRRFFGLRIPVIPKPFQTKEYYSGVLFYLYRRRRVVLFLEAVGMRKCCCVAVESRLEALCFCAFSASTACFTRDDPSSKRVGGLGLGPKPPKLRCSWRCAQPRAAKVIQQAYLLLVKWHRYLTLLPSATVQFMLLAGGTRNVPR